MIIEKLTATFGKLNGDVLDLERGLNIIRAPNESGKSTWCAFIRAMLYGINTSDRDSKGHLSDKNKYMPWSGVPMSGVMDVVHEGKEITITRSSLGNSPMKKFSAVYTGTAEPVAGLDDSNVGEILTGASEKVYERTAFIRQAGMRVDQSSELEKRIAALVSSGSENRSYSEADEDIRAWMRKLRYNRSGSMPRLEAEKNELERQYMELERKAEELSDLRQSMNRAGERRARYQDELELHRKIEKRAMLRSLSESTVREERARRDIERLTDELSVNGHVPTKDEITDVRTKCSTMDSLNILYVKAAEERERTEEALAEAENTYRQTEFYNKYETEDTAVGKASFVAGYVVPPPAPPPQPPVPKTYLLHIISFAVLVFLGVVIGTLGYTVLPGIRYYAAAGFAFSVLSLIFMFVFIGKASKEKAVAAAYVPPVIIDPLDEYYAAFETDSVDELKEKAAAFLTARNALQDAKAATAAAKKTFDDAEASVKASENLVKSAAGEILKNVDDPYTVLSDLAALENRLEALTRARFEMLSSQSVIETLTENISDDVDVSENDFLPVPVHSREEAQSEYEKALAEYNSLTQSYNIAYGELKAIGDPAVISSRIAEVTEELSRQELVYNSLEAARAALSDANTELQTRFSPVISKRAGEYMSLLTGGRYSDIVFDKAFNAMAKSSGEAVSRSILSLSEGTADQIYLALRLAMSSLILSGDEPAPIILDDTLVNFDNNRMAHAIRLLRKMSETRQIILFTCHDREIEFASQYPKVNTIVFNEKE